MKRHDTIVTAAAIALASILTLVGVQITSGQQQSEQIAQQSQSQVEQKTQEYAYLLRAYQEHIGVFRPGESQPAMVLDVWLHHLPAYDQQQLEQGIYLQSYEELVKRMEDYIS